MYLFWRESFSSLEWLTICFVFSFRATFNVWWSSSNCNLHEGFFSIYEVLSLTKEYNVKNAWRWWWCWVKTMMKSQDSYGVKSNQHRQAKPDTHCHFSLPKPPSLSQSLIIQLKDSDAESNAAIEEIPLFTIVCSHVLSFLKHANQSFTHQTVQRGKQICQLTNKQGTNLFPSSAIQCFTCFSDNSRHV